jgi:hypothetical protein
MPLTACSDRLCSSVFDAWSPKAVCVVAPFPICLLLMSYRVKALPYRANQCDNLSLLTRTHQSSCERKSDDDREQKMGGRREHGFDSSTRGIVHQERKNNRVNAGLEERLSERPRFGDADAHLFYEPGRARTQPFATGRTRKGEVIAVKKDHEAKENKSTRPKLKQHAVFIATYRINCIASGASI